jgi:hypothetical protein
LSGWTTDGIYLNDNSGTGSTAQVILRKQSIPIAEFHQCNSQSKERYSEQYVDGKRYN